MYKHDLFLKNFPMRKQKSLTNLGFVSSLNFKGKLLDENKNVCFIWTGNQRILKLEKDYPTKIKNRLRKKSIEIYLYEPICLSINGEYNCSFYSEFNSKVNYDNDIIVSEELESIRIFKQKNDLSKVKVYTSDYNLTFLKNRYPDLELYCLDSFLRHITIKSHRSNNSNKILKKFWCGNWRYTIHRHLIMSYLVHLDGNFSWNLKCSFEDLKKNIWFNFDDLQRENPERFLKIKKGAGILNENVLRIDTKIDQIVVENSSEVYIPGENSPPRSANFLDSYKECFCAVVNETRFAQPFGNFSEKTTTAIEARLPIILVAPPKSLEYLKKFGFKTFDRWWDESYDQEEDHEKRLIKIFDLIDYINSKTISDLEIMYREMKEILDHNLEIVRTIPYNKDVL